MAIHTVTSLWKVPLPKKRKEVSMAVSAGIVAPAKSQPRLQNHITQ